jgi:signal transduction histidine kinase
VTLPSSGLDRLRALTIRAKLVVTFVVTAVVAFGAFTFLSFHYWRHESVVTSERQALLAASATRAAIESSLRANRPEVARRNVRRLLEGGSVAAARVYDDDRVIVFSSSPTEEGQSFKGLWLATADELPQSGLARLPEEDGSVRVFIPVSAPGASVLEVVVREDRAQAAMRRGAYLGVGLVLACLLVATVLIFTVVEREVVTPIQRVEDLLPRTAEPSGAGEDEIHGIERAVVRLLEDGRRAEAEALARDRKLAAQDGLARVGGLAAEMAHELKRPLASVRTAVAVLERERLVEPRGRDLLDAARGQLDHLSETLDDLFSLATPVEPTEEPFDLADALDGALLRLAGLPGAERVRVHRDYPRGIMTRGDPRKMSQAFLNLLTNGVEAMPDGGDLTISVRETPGGVRVEINDTGPGLSPEEARRVLRPFYTTKPSGTGLGLSVVTRIVERHGAALRIAGGEGGTSVSIVFPGARCRTAREMAST